MSVDDIANKISSMHQRKKPWERLMIIPFETASSLFIIYTGISGVLKFGASSIVFSEGVQGADIFNVAFVVAGLMILSGSGLKRVLDEIMGLAMSVGLMMARVFVILSTTGYNESTHNLLMISFLMIIAAVVRLYTLAIKPKIIDIDIT